ncbi:YkvA family protein [Photobacterium atrarenae]|uniref:YkvA family protein n=1 Tax=Photobacterium atrarenae TaxID=865757 RepID=A0ABY5GIM0_9GAMM|nr:YkvA family protein [Photobacterium atrarenae]UTV29031.1 YkvA family protein [Photobacterium atrarenae]
MNNMTEQKADQTLRDSAGKVTERDLETVLDKEQEIERKVRASGALREYLNAVVSMFALIKAYWQGEYREIPWFTIAAIVAALLYVFNPMDLLPDVLPFVGLVDDAMVIATCLKLVKQDLSRFEEWQQSSMTSPRAGDNGT